MTPARWSHIKALQPSERMIHVGAPVYRNPLALLAEAAGEPFFGPQYLVRKGKTLNLGRNKAKRQKRETATFALVAPSGRA